MDDRQSELFLLQLINNSTLRIARSYHSIESANALLERSRRTLEQSEKLLHESKRLAQDPLSCPWRRSAG